MEQHRFSGATKVKIIQGKVNGSQCYDDVEQKLADFIHNHYIVEIKQSLCQASEYIGILVYTVFYNEYED